MASMYAVYHGPQGLSTIAARVHRLTGILRAGLAQLGLGPINDTFFDTLTIATGARTGAIHELATAAHVNLRRIDTAHIGISLDETTTRDRVRLLWTIFAPEGAALPDFDSIEPAIVEAWPPVLRRTTPFLTHPTFNRYHSETAMLRYLRRLADKDIALDRE